MDGIEGRNRRTHWTVTARVHTGSYDGSDQHAGHEQKKNGDIFKRYRI